MLTRTKPQDELCTSRCMNPSNPPHRKEAFRIKGAICIGEQNKNTNNNSKIEDGQRKKP